jgi:hypothetical protein
MDCKKRCPLEDGSLFLHALGLGLIASGLFALYLSAIGKFLPHDEYFLGMTAADLCSLHGCRIVHFMIHDRVSFGGSIIAIGLLYHWLAAGPLRQGHEWAWWLFLVSGTVGFLSFFAYLGYGYLDTWHGLGTLLLLPCFIVGLVQSKRHFGRGQGIRCLLSPSLPWSWTTAAGWGRACLLGVAIGLVGAGSTILLVGMTCIFVPQDLEFMQVDPDVLQSLNANLLPLIAHDRAGFGGGVCCGGVTLFFCVWNGWPSRSLWYVLSLAGSVAFGTAIGIHPIVGYVDAFHLFPAILGAVIFLAGLLLTFPQRADSSVSLTVLEPAEIRRTDLLHYADGPRA